MQRRPLSQVRSVSRGTDSRAANSRCPSPADRRRSRTAHILRTRCHPPVARTVNLSGPRFGVTFLSDSTVRKLKNEDGIDVGSVVTQFGWQFEKQFYSGQSGPTAVTEGVVLVGGLEQGVALPSLSWLVGIRTRNGAEFGVGPNVTPVGVALAAAAGMTLRAGVLNVPVNLAVAHSKSGMRVSLLSGFSLRKR